MTELDSLKSDVAEIKALLIAKFSPATSINAEVETSKDKGSHSTTQETSTIPQSQSRPIELSTAMISQAIPRVSPVTVTGNTVGIQEYRSEGGGPTSFFLEPNPLVPNLTSVFYQQLEPQPK